MRQYPPPPPPFLSFLVVMEAWHSARPMRDRYGINTYERICRFNLIAIRPLPLLPRSMQIICFIVKRENPLSPLHRLLFPVSGAGRSSEVERSLMVRWVVGSILHGVGPLSYFSFQPVLHDWCNKGRGMCYPVCGMVHIKEPLLLIDKSSLCGGSGFPFSLSEWSLTICLTPYNRR